MHLRPVYVGMHGYLRRIEPCCVRVPVGGLLVLLYKRVRHRVCARSWSSQRRNLLERYVHRRNVDLLRGVHLHVPSGHTHPVLFQLLYLQR